MSADELWKELGRLSGIIGVLQARIHKLEQEALTDTRLAAIVKEGMPVWKETIRLALAPKPPGSPPVS